MPTVAIGGYRYYLLGGGINKAPVRFRGLRANYWWPADKAWMVSSHFDFDSTYVGSSKCCSDELIVSSDLECWAVDRLAKIGSDADTLNRPVAE